MSWDMSIGEEDTRKAIQARHRGSHSRGISAPSRNTGLDNILLWWQPKRAESFGYADGWTINGDAFYFSGTGQVGDQLFGPPYNENLRVREHLHIGDHVRLLRYVGKNRVQYVADLQLDAAQPWQWRDGPDRFGETRKIIQFRFLPLGDCLRFNDDPIRETHMGISSVEDLPSIPPAPTETQLELLNSATFRQTLRAREVLAERTELQLVYKFRDWLRSELTLEATGLRIPFAPEHRELRADLFIALPGILVEAKSSASREKV